MAPPSGLQISSSASDYGNARLPFSRSITAPTGFNTAAAAQQQQQQRRPDPSHLAPEDAFHVTTPPRRLKGFEPSGSRDLLARHLYRKDGAGSRSRSRRRKRPWKKLLWVKQSCKRHPSKYSRRGEETLGVVEDVHATADR